MATPPPRREKKASGSSGPPPAPTEKAGRPTDASLFIFIFLRKEPARLWRICGIQHGGWSLRPPLPRALTSASRTSGSDDPPPKRRERPGGPGYCACADSVSWLRYPVPQICRLRVLSLSRKGAHRRPGVRIAGAQVCPALPGAGVCLSPPSLDRTGLDEGEFQLSCPSSQRYDFSWLSFIY